MKIQQYLNEDGKFKQRIIHCRDLNAAELAYEECVQSAMSLVLGEHEQDSLEETELVYQVADSLFEKIELHVIGDFRRDDSDQ